MHTRIALATLLLLAASTAVAATTFETLDTDFSGGLSPEEASRMPGLMDRWRDIDVNDDGRLDPVEFAVIEPGAAHPEAKNTQAVIVPAQ